MKKTFLLITTFSLILLISVSLWAGPKLSIDRNTFEFDTVPEGTVIRHNFIINNIGDEPLLIKNILTG